MQRAALIGNPVDHSLSPFMHNAAFRALGIDAVYELWHTEADDVPTAVARVREPGILGANVTVPHKQAVMPLVDELTETARRIGAVNTLVSNGNSLLGDNTDAFGFRRAIEERYGSLTGERAVILGAGGAARAVIVALQEMGLRSLTIANRTRARAEALATGLGASVVDWDDAPERAFPDAGVLVNATSLGWHDELPVDAGALAALRAGALVVDLTYRDTALLRAASASGLRTLDGLGMLVHQGARAFSLWTAREAPVDAMREAVLSEQARRA